MLLNFEKFLFEATGTFSDVAHEPVDYKPKSGKITMERIKEIIATYGKNIQKKPEETTTSSSSEKIDLTKDNTDFQIKAKDGEVYKLQFIQLLLVDKKKYCTYSIKTEDEEINNQLINYTLLKDEEYNNIIELHKLLSTWRNTASSSVKPETNTVQQNKQNVNQQSTNQKSSNQQNVDQQKDNQMKQELNNFNYPLFSKLFEINTTSFDDTLLNVFASAPYQNRENYDFVKKMLISLKTSNPDLYNKSFKQFDELIRKNLIIKISEKNKFMSKWIIQRKSSDTKKFYRVLAGDPIKSGDIIRFELGRGKIDQNGQYKIVMGKYMTSEIQITNILK